MRVVFIGECMMEFLRQDDGLWRQGFAGDTLNVAWAMRALLPVAAKVDYLTRVGTDALFGAMLDILRSAGIGTAAITRDPKRTVGCITFRPMKTESAAFLTGVRTVRRADLPKTASTFWRL